MRFDRDPFGERYQMIIDQWTERVNDENWKDMRKYYANQLAKLEKWVGEGNLKWEETVRHTMFEVTRKAKKISEDKWNGEKNLCKPFEKPGQGKMKDERNRLLAKVKIGVPGNLYKFQEPTHEFKEN